MKILIIEDEVNLAKSIALGLKQENYKTDLAFTGEEGYNLAICQKYDCLIMDVTLPKISGFEVCKKLRNENYLTPIIILTASDTLEDKISGFNFGADDYLIKPFAFSELLARIKALIRRDKKINTALILKIDNLELDLNSHLVKRGNTEIKLTGKEYALLEFFMLNSKQILTREKILNHVWDNSFESLSNIVDVMVKRLRKKIDRNFVNEIPLFITVRGIGYRLG